MQTQAHTGLIYFDNFGAEHVPEEIRDFIGNKNIIANIFRVQANSLIMCGYFYIGFIDSLDKTKLTDQTKFRLNKLSKIENYFN